MAIFHLAVRPLSRTHGRSAVFAAAYRTGTKIYDERRGRAADYRRKAGEVADIFMVLPADCGEWPRDRLWNAAEAAETRTDACVSREIILALPHELELDDHRSMLVELATEIVQAHGCAIESSIHRPRPRALHDDVKPPNPHCHMQLTTRRLNRAGFGEKTRELDDWATGPGIIRRWRERWCRIVNARLAERGLATRVDHRSHRDRALVEMPTVHEGTDRGRRARQRHNEATRAMNTKLREALSLSEQDRLARKRAADLEADEHQREEPPTLPDQARAWRPRGG